jgi:predicted nucleic acid-binding protein
LIVVSDTSPVLNLARIGRLRLLPLLYGQVLIPSAVFEELTASKQDLPPAIDLVSEPWLIVASAKDGARVQKLRGHLDPGEAEAIVLALERRADLLLVDERRGRRIAMAAGLTVTGLLGLVVKAKQAGLIDQGKPVVDELIEVARFWIGPDLYAEVLAELGEPG